MSELTIVTAFFDIGRAGWKGYARGSDRYVSYFEHWARLQNRVILYSTPDICKKAMAVRERFGLADRTICIPVSSITDVDPMLYEKIKNAMAQKESWRFHKNLRNPESWNPLYNYMTDLKPYWVQDAVRRGLADGMVAWLDFGFNHGGQFFPFAEDFNYLWQYDFSQKIHIFLFKEMDELPIFRIVQNMDTYVQGGIIIAPSGLWKTLWEDFRGSILALAECGLADDDQLIMLMAYRRHPDLFETHMTTWWGEPVYTYGGNHLHVRSRKPAYPNTFSRRFKRFRRKWMTRLDIRRRKGTDIEKAHFK